MGLSLSLLDEFILVYVRWVYPSLCKMGLSLSLLDEFILVYVRWVLTLNNK